jgi:hypothetical protein
MIVVKRIGLAGLALAVSAGAAQAVIGGAESPGPLARATLMVLSSRGGVCSAVVVGRDVVLTAAHCVTGSGELRVHFRDGSGQPVLIAPAETAVHPGYDANGIRERRRSIDLALLRVADALPDEFAASPLSAAIPLKNTQILIGGYGLAREGDRKSMGTFRTAPLNAVEPYGPSRILLWAEGSRGTGACQGDSGGPLTAGSMVVAVTSWSRGVGRSRCGGLTQGILVGPQRDWIDRILTRWGRAARWE